MDEQESAILSAVIDAIPSPVFVVDDDFRVHGANSAARPLLGPSVNSLGAIECLYHSEPKSTCGKGPRCHSCFILSSVDESFESKAAVTRAGRINQGSGGRQVLVSAAPLMFRGKHFVVLTIQHVHEIASPGRLIPICTHCKRIRNEREYWDSVEHYFERHLDLEFSHGICPECLDEIYPEISERVKNGGIGPAEEAG
ncbi:MAG TPA: PAS domain-containing protein [Bacteroidota bacterium]|nr:PAS domain-containing protein [Bacteroidota bacterium]